jgi:hypothetical protein
MKTTKQLENLPVTQFYLSCKVLINPALKKRTALAVEEKGTTKGTLFAPLDVVTPVPPLATFRVPAKVTAPDVALDGVNPVVPALNVVTPVAGAFVHAGTPAARVRICPLVPAAKNVVVDVAL